MGPTFFYCHILIKGPIAFNQRGTITICLTNGQIRTFIFHKLTHSFWELISFDLFVAVKVQSDDMTCAMVSVQPFRDHCCKPFCAAADRKVNNERVFLMDQTRPFSSFSRRNDYYSTQFDSIWKKRRWYLNPGPQDGRCRWIHWAMAPP